MLQRNWLVAGLVLGLTFGLLGIATLAKRAHPDFVDREGWTALQRAARNGHLAGIERLLAAGADPNLDTKVERRRVAPGHHRVWSVDGRQAPEGAPPLVHAAAGGHVEAVRLLLQAGAQVDASTLATLSRSSTCEACWRAIAAAKEGQGQRWAHDGLSAAIRSFNVEAARVLLDSGADLRRIHTPNEPDVLHELLRGCQTEGHPLRPWPPVPSDDGRRAELILLALEHGARQVPHQRELDLLPYDRAVGSCSSELLGRSFEAHGTVLSDGPDGRLRAALFVLDPAAARAALAEGADPDQRLSNGQSLEDWLQANAHPPFLEQLRILLGQARSARGKAPAPTPP